MTLTLAQIDVEPADLEGNLDRAHAAVETAAGRGADLVVLPELFTVGFFAFDEYAASAVGLDDELVDRLRSLAIDHDVGLVGGSFVEDLQASADGGFRTPATTGYANTVPIFDRDGTLLEVYRKRHLFGYDSREADLLTPGENAAIVDFEGLRIGTTVCYDLRFPETYRDLVDAGVTTILIPSAWPYPRTDHWTTLARARAIENLSYVGAANGSGTFEDARLCGRSTVYDPWGTTLASSGDEATLVTADIDPERVERVRSDFPALRDRRP
ncbi:MAG: nitrilase-related carbon-nitrogen hydrolase [Halobacteriota archaeon]